VLYHETINEANGIGGLVVGDDLGLKSGVGRGGSRMCLSEARHENRNGLVQEQRLIAQCQLPWEYFLKIWYVNHHGGDEGYNIQAAKLSE